MLYIPYLETNFMEFLFNKIILYENVHTHLLSRFTHIGRERKREKRLGIIKFRFV